jgi:hypothetical protein
MNWISAGIGAAMMAVLSFNLHQLDMYFVDKKHAKEVTAAKVEAKASCDAARTLTEKVDDGYKNIDAGNRKYVNAVSVRGAECLAITGAPAGVDDGTPSAGRPVGQGVKGYRIIPASKFLAYAHEASTYRTQLLACQQFITLEQQQAAAGQKPPK